MTTQRMTFEQWLRDTPEQWAKSAKVLARLGPIRRQRPRDPTEGAILCSIGTPEHLIGPPADRQA